MQKGTAINNRCTYQIESKTTILANREGKESSLNQ